MVRVGLEHECPRGHRVMLTAEQCRATTTTTTTTATLPVGNQSVNSINSDDDMNALAKKLADFVGSYGSMDAKDLLGVPCGGQLLCEALARVAGV